MGTGHLQPHGRQIHYYKSYFVSVTEQPEELAERDMAQNHVVDRMIRKYDFKRPSGGREDVTNGGYVVARTGHGVELRVRPHPGGGKYFYLVVKNAQEFNKENLAVQHVQNSYKHELKKAIDAAYGEVRRPTGNWTSTALEVTH